tara:strand:+ start:48 stop:887 length:840 start_codon:yes stop_codon:yes gene_type:complete
MKIILGDNQFFGVNHHDLTKGESTKQKFQDVADIENFINDALKCGMDGFMINSNDLGYKLISEKEFDVNTEIHYSIPYPHKYASMVNENGILSLLTFVLKNTSFLKNALAGIKFILTRNITHFVPLGIDLEVPKNLKKGSYVYVQNIFTDMILGLNREDLFLKIINKIIDLGYKPGLMTLNPIMLDSILKKIDESKLEKLIVCFNINTNGFNVFPSKDVVEKFISSEKKYQTMGMSVFASGGGNINDSIKYIRSLNLDYIVFGSSSINNIENNLKNFKK